LNSPSLTIATVFTPYFSSDSSPSPPASICSLSSVVDFSFLYDFWGAVTPERVFLAFFSSAHLANHILLLLSLGYGILPDLSSFLSLYGLSPHCLVVTDQDHKG